MKHIANEIINYNNISVWCLNLVGSAPRLLEPLKDVTAVVPSQVVLRCKIDTGEPPAKVSFFKEIYSGAKYDIRQEDGTVQLAVRSTELSDAATFRCKAANNHGTVECEARLIVHGESFNEFYIMSGSFAFYIVITSFAFYTKCGS